MPKRRTVPVEPIEIKIAETVEEAQQMIEDDKLEKTETHIISGRRSNIAAVLAAAAMMGGSRADTIDRGHTLPAPRDKKMKRKPLMSLLDVSTIFSDSSKNDSRDSKYTAEVAIPKVNKAQQKRERKKAKRIQHSRGNEHG